MNVNKKSFICLILALLMLTSFTLPIGAFADEYEEILFDDYFDDFYDDQYTESYDYFDDFYDDQYEPYDDVLEEDFYEEFSEDAPIFDEIFDENTEIDTDPLFDESTEETNNDDDNELIGQLAFGDTETFDAAELEIETQPVDWEGPETETASFTVSAKGGTAPYTYQWQYQSKGKWYNRSGATSETFSISANGRDGYTVRCVVTDAAGASVTSNQAVITIAAPQDFTVEGVTYRIISAEEVEIAAYDGTASSLTIPSKVNGYDVTAVGEQAFMNQAITSISLPNSIKYIRSQAFKGCVNLATMTTHD